MNIHEIQFRQKFVSSPEKYFFMTKKKPKTEMKSENFLTIVILIEFDRIDKLIKGET